jgi:hypothetical protein
MAKIVFNVRDRRLDPPAEFAKSILRGVSAELWKILFPPPKPKPTYKEVWARRVDTGKWVKVWFYQY